MAKHRRRSIGQGDGTIFAFAVVRDEGETLISQIEAALPAIAHVSAVARAATLAGFTAPLSYAPTQPPMEELRAHLFASYGHLGFQQAIQLYWPSSLAALLGFSALLIWAVVRTQRLNARLKASERFRKRVFEGSYLPVVVMDADTREYVDANPAAVKIYGFSSRKETLRKTLLDVSAALQYDGSPSRDRIQEHIEKALLEGSTAFEWRHQRPDGEVWDAQVHLMAFESDSRRLLQCTIEDITPRKRDEADRARLEEQLRQSKMESIGRLAGGIANDFNNLLTVINGYTAMLLHRKHLNGPDRQAVVHISKAGERAAELTRQLLAFSKRQILQPVLLDLNQLIRDSETMFGRLLGEDIRLILVLNPSIGLVMADPGQIHQALMNLVANARDAMAHGGTLTISTTEIQKEEEHPPGEVAPRSYCLLEVSDTGGGIDAATREHIFEPFFSARGEAGTGLGLSTVYGIVQQSKGDIEVFSEPGMGTTFRICLPCTERPPEREQVPEPRRLPSRHPATILLVEDQEDVREFARQVLDGGGYNVLEAASGEAAMQAAMDRREPIHLLLTDVVLQGMNGLELSEGYLRLHPESSVLFTSGYTDDAMARRGVIHGSIAFVAKPYSPEVLLAKVAEVLNAPRDASRAPHR